MTSTCSFKTKLLVTDKYIDLLLFFIRDTGFYENSGFQNVQNGDEYEEVVSKSGKSDIMHYIQNI